jgi:ethanolamine utilization protein EutP (predicted NTPase)
MNLTGLNLVYTPIEIIKYEAKENPNKVNKVVTIKKEQSLFDLSLQYYGAIDNVYNLIQSNSYLDSILTDNFNADVLNYTSEVNYVNSYFSKNLIDIATKPNGIGNFLLQDINTVSSRKVNITVEGKSTKECCTNNGLEINVLLTNIVTGDINSFLPAGVTIPEPETSLLTQKELNYNPIDGSYTITVAYVCSEGCELL